MQLMAAFVQVTTVCELQTFTWPTACDTQLAQETALPMGALKATTMFWKWQDIRRGLSTFKLSRNAAAAYHY